MAKQKATPDKRICVACGVCVLQCKRAAIHIYKGCHAFVELEKCVGCGLCQRACPANAISMMEDNSEVKDGI